MLGGVGIGECLAGAALCFVVTLFGYDLSGGGAGDVKLAAAIGALLGVARRHIRRAYSYVVAAIAIIAWSTWKHGPLALVKAGGRTIGSMLGPLWPFPLTSRRPGAVDEAGAARPVLRHRHAARGVGACAVMTTIIAQSNSAQQRPAAAAA